MNRKDRRAIEKAQGNNKAKSAPVAVPDNTLAESLRAQGMSLKATGKDAEAIPFLTKALQHDPTFADVHFTLAMMAQTKPALNIRMEDINATITDKATLGRSYQSILTIMKKRRQYKEALVCQTELCRLHPTDYDEKANLALLYNMIGQKDNALRLLAELMIEAPDKKVYKSLFATTCGSVSYNQHEPSVKRALQICFDNIYEANLYKAYATWAVVVLRDPACSGLAEAVMNTSSEEVFVKWIENTSSAQRAFLQERFFLDGLRLLTVASPILETCLTHMRRWLCLNAHRLAQKNELSFFEPFLMALGEQCFYNEYIYTTSTDESSIINELLDTIKSRQTSPLTPIQICALISCYHPLHKVMADEKEFLSELSRSSGDFQRLTKIQFFDPAEENEIKKNLKHFGTPENEISKSVQSQYEENPYPRWISLTNFPTPSDYLPLPDQERRNSRSILIAGCGTGLHALSTTAIHPQAHVTAIDLSRSSLAYAQRKARECGLADRVDFIHADILNMIEWPSTFDIVESSGVLHHMQDPFKGWQVLNKLLKPGGYFKVGLYSEVARQQIVEARTYVKDNGFPSTTEGIRACRESIFKLPSNHPMRKYLLASNDFYATSLIRDLIFHVQEHHMTLPQIKDMMDKLGLVCTSFALTSPETALKYDKMFPDDPQRCNMLNWHTFEQKYPETFVGMYQFWCKKIA